MLVAMPGMADSLRIAQFNAALSRQEPGALVQELRLGGSPQIAAVAEIIQRIRPDILLINEIDHDPAGNAATLLAAYLREGRGNAEGIDFPHVLAPPSNTGDLAPADLNGDGDITLPADGFGFGFHPGHYAMAVFSRFPFGQVRTFRETLWRAMPGNLMPPGHYSDAAASVFRLSSKTHLDVTINVDGTALHLLAAHPTPPVFDGPEDANGRRNADEIRFWTDYIEGAAWIVDDSGTPGGLGDGFFVIAGDLNADRGAGDGRRTVIAALLDHPRVEDPQPRSPGAAAQPGRKADFAGDPHLATAAFGRPGPLRVDYVLPDARLTVTGAGVFWPAPDDPLRHLVGDSGDVSSDHRLVWVDVTLPDTP